MAAAHIRNPNECQPEIAFSCASSSETQGDNFKWNLCFLIGKIKLQAKLKGLFPSSFHSENVNNFYSNTNGSF